MPSLRNVSSLWVADLQARSARQLSASPGAWACAVWRARRGDGRRPQRFLRCIGRSAGAQESCQVPLSFSSLLLRCNVDRRHHRDIPGQRMCNSIRSRMQLEYSTSICLDLSVSI